MNSFCRMAVNRMSKRHHHHHSSIAVKVCIDMTQVFCFFISVLYCYRANNNLSHFLRIGNEIFYRIPFEIPLIVFKIHFVLGTCRTIFHRSNKYDQMTSHIIHVYRLFPYPLHSTQMKMFQQ